MIKHTDMKIIKFGYGTIVSSCIGTKVVLKSVRRSLKIGTANCHKLKNIEFLEEIRLTYKDDMIRLLDDLENVSKENSIILFRDCILDFSKYNKESVNVVFRTISACVKNHTMLLAA